MERACSRRTSLAIRATLAALWAFVCVAILAAPILQARGHVFASSMFYALFAPVCHQNPARSFTIFGHSWAVCQRCSGIYLGLFLASWVPFEMNGILDSISRRRIWVLCGTAPLILDVFLQSAGLWTNTPVSRFITGLLFGIMLSSLAVPALAELAERFLMEHPRGGALRGHS